MNFTLDAGHQSQLKQFAPFIPYVAVTLGLYVLRSAWAGILLYHVGMFAVLTLTKQWDFGHTPRIRQDWAVLLVVTIVSALGGIFIFLLWPIMKLPHLALSPELTAIGLEGGMWRLFIVYYFTINPLLEELFWRGYLGSKQIRPISNDVLFAGYHMLVLLAFVTWPWMLLSFVILVGAGWFWRQLARHYESLWIPIASHAAADAGIIGAVFLLTR